jgi:TRAP-type transport system small permease protein
VTALLALCNGLGLVNSMLLWLGRWIGAICLGLMVVAILAQVFYRYVLNNALPWPEEASRFLMLWSTGLMAPTAFRRGGFVAIDMIIRPGCRSF